MIKISIFVKTVEKRENLSRGRLEKNSEKDNYLIGTDKIISRKTQNSKPKYFNEI